MLSPTEVAATSDGGCQRSTTVAELPACVQAHMSAADADITGPTGTPAATRRNAGDGDEADCRRAAALATAEADSATGAASALQPLASFADATGLDNAARTRRHSAAPPPTCGVTRTAVPLLSRPALRAPVAAPLDGTSGGTGTAETEKAADHVARSGTPTPATPSSSTVHAALTPATPATPSAAPARPLTFSASRVAGAGSIHRTYQPTSLFGAKRVSSSASSSMTLAADITRRVTSAALGPTSSSSNATDRPSESDVTTAAPAGAAASAGAEPVVAESRSGSSPVRATPRVRSVAERVLPDTAAPAADGGSAERDAVAAVCVALTRQVDALREGQAAVLATKTAATVTRVATSTWRNPLLMSPPQCRSGASPLADPDAQRAAPDSDVGVAVDDTGAEEAGGATDLQLFSNTEAPTMHLAQYDTRDDQQRATVPPAASDVDLVSGNEESGSEDSDAESETDTVVTNDSGLEHLNMTLLVSHVAVPVSVQAVLRNPDATREELWTALRTACQQCGVLQRRLARAEGALADESDNRPVAAGATAAAASSVPSHVRTTAPPPPPLDGPLVSASFTPAADPEVQPGDAAPPSPTRTHRSSTPAQRERERLAERTAAAAAAAAASTVSLHVAPLSVQTERTAAASHHVSGGTSPSAADGRKAGSDIAAALRDRVVEAIRRVEADRRAPGAAAAAAAAAAASQSRGDSVLATQDAPPRLAKPVPAVPPVEEKEEERSADSERPAVAMIPTAVSAPAGDGCDDSDSAGPGSPAPPSRPSPMTSLNTAVPPVLMAAGPRFGSVERISCMRPPSPPRTRGPGGSGGAGRATLTGQQHHPPPQQPPHNHRRPRDLPSITVESPPPAAAAEVRMAETEAVPPSPWLPRCPSHGSAASAMPPPLMSPTLVGLPQRTHGAPAAAGGGGGATAGLTTSLSGTLPSVASSSQSGRHPRGASSPSPCDSLRGRQQQQQQQQALMLHQVPRSTSKTALSCLSTLRQSDEAPLAACSASPRPSSPTTSVLSAASVKLEVLRQLQQEEAPVPPPAVDDHKAALRQWRREASKMKSTQGAS